MGYRYIGSKARIAEEIMNYIGNPKGNDYFIDAFSGTGAVAEMAANRGWRIKINDMMKSAVVMSEARLLSDEDVNFENVGGYANCITYLNSLDGIKGFIWKEYSPASKNEVGIERKYFSERNAQKIDAIIKVIQDWSRDKRITEKECTLLMMNLISAVNDVANIAGTYGCFLSKWCEQADNDLTLRTMPLRSEAVHYICYNKDVFDIDCNCDDVVYLDPPYTKRQYASYYHLLETIVSGDMPEVEGVSGLRPWKEKASVFCYKTKALNALTELIKAQKAYRVVLSYSNEGHIKLDDLIKELKPYGTVKLVELSTIGRYTPNRVAVSNNTEVKEYLIDFRRKKD